MTVITFDTEKVYGNTVMYTVETKSILPEVVEQLKNNINHSIPSTYQQGTILILSGYREYPFISMKEKTEETGYGYASWYYFPHEKQCDDAPELVKFWEKNKSAVLYTNMALFSGRPTKNDLP